MTDYSLYSSTANATTGQAPQQIVTIERILNVDWDQDDEYTDETAHLISARGSIRLAPPGQAITSTSGIIAQATFELNDGLNRFNPFITTGALYSDISGGKAYRAPVQFNLSLDGETWHTIFQGLTKIPSNRTLTPRQPKTVSLDCRGNEEKLLNYRHSTTKADFATWHDEGRTEAELIAEVLGDVGISSGEMDIDDGYFVIPWFWMDEESVIESCWQLAAAAGGRFYCRADGVFAYENLSHWLVPGTNHTVAQATYGRIAAGSPGTRIGYENLNAWYDDDNLASRVTARHRLHETSVESGVLWEAGEPITVPPGSSVTVIAEMGSPAYRYDSLTYAAFSTGGQDMSSQVDVTHLQFAQRMPVTFTNNDTDRAAVIRNLQITGISVDEVGTVTTTLESEDTFWDAPTRASASLVTNLSSRWLQSQAQADALAQLVLDRQETPAPMYKLSGCDGQPQRKIGDWIVILDAETIPNINAIVIGIDWRFSASTGFKQDLLCVDKNWMFSQLVFFTLGTHKLGSLDPDNQPIYY